MESSTQFMLRRSPELHMQWIWTVGIYLFRPRRHVVVLAGLLEMGIPGLPDCVSL